MAYTDDITPAMTDNDAPSPYEVFESGHSFTHYGWLVFDHDSGTDWYNYEDGFPYWVTFDFGAGNTKIVTKYRLTASGVDVIRAERAPEDFTLQGSNNNSDWTILDTVTGEISWGVGESREFEIDNSTEYRYYRLNITDTESTTNYIQLAEVEMYETIISVMSPKKAIGRNKNEE